MELAIKSRKDNKALGRQELECVLSFEKAMPSRKQIREAICAATGASPELLVIKKAEPDYGAKTATVEAHIYKDKQSMSVEPEYLLVRDGLAEKKKEEKQKAAAKK